MAQSMNRFTCYVFSGLCAILPLSQEPAPAQEPPPVVEHQQLDAIHRAGIKNKVEQLIQSASIRDRARAAYFTGAYRLKDVAPALIELLNPNSLEPDGENGYVNRAVLDSLL